MPAPGVQYPNNSIPLFDDGDEITCAVSAANGGLVPGSRFIKIGGQPADAPDIPIVTLCAAGDEPFGVSGFDGDASGATAPERITCWHAPHKVNAVKAGAALVAGELVTSDATGQAVPFAGAAAGAVSAGTAVFDAALGAQAFIDRSCGAGRVHA
jgi:hypothetical protein